MASSVLNAQSCTVTPNSTHLAVEKAFCLLCVSQQGLEIEGLREDAVTALPHSPQLVPACVQGLEPLG